jgi:hypothetical protein
MTVIDYTNGHCYNFFFFFFFLNWTRALHKTLVHINFVVYGELLTCTCMLPFYSTLLFIVFLFVLFCVVCLQLL